MVVAPREHRRRRGRPSTRTTPPSGSRPRPTPSRGSVRSGETWPPRGRCRHTLRERATGLRADVPARLTPGTRGRASARRSSAPCPRASSRGSTCAAASASVSGSTGRATSTSWPRWTTDRPRRTSRGCARPRGRRRGVPGRHASTAATCSSDDLAGDPRACPDVPCILNGASSRSVPVHDGVVCVARARVARQSPSSVLPHDELGIWTSQDDAARFTRGNLDTYWRRNAEALGRRWRPRAVRASGGACSGACSASRACTTSS